MPPAIVSGSNRFALLVEGIPRPFWALLIGTFITRAGSFVMPLLFVYLTQARGLALPLAGAITSLYGLGALIGSFIGGAMADRFGRRATMLTSLLLGSAFLLVLGLAQEIWQLAVATFLTSVSADAYRPASQAMVADIVPPQHRLKAFGLQYWAINLGFGIAAVVGGYMATRNFSALFLADALTTVILAFIVWREVPESRPVLSRAPETPKEQVKAAFSPFWDRRYATFLVLNFFIALLFFQHLSALPDDMKSKGLTTQDFGLSVATNGLLIVLLQPFATQWAARFTQARTLALAAALTGIGFGATHFASSLPTYALTIAIWTLGEILFSPVNSEIVATLSPTHLRGRYQGAFTITWSLAAMIAPLVGTTVIAMAGHRTLWIGCFGVGLGVALAHLTLSARTLPQRDAGRVERVTT